MSHSRIHYLGICLLCFALLFGDEVIAQHEKARASDLTTSGAVNEDSSKDNEAKLNDVTEQDTKVEVVKDGVDKDEVVVEQEADEENKTSVLRISVIQNGMNGLPIKNARVMVSHDGGKEYVIQTDEAGVVMLSDLPYGKIEVDVTSSGRKSDGDSLVLDEPQETLTFHLKPR